MDKRSNEQLLADFAASIEMDVSQECLDFSADTLEIRSEILRRMAETNKGDN